VAAAAWRERPGRPPEVPLRLPGTGEAAAAAETVADAPRGGHLRGPWNHCGPRTGSCGRLGRPGAASRKMYRELARKRRGDGGRGPTAVGGGGRAGATATEADPSDPERERAPEMRRRACAAVLRHRPWVSPRRTKSPVRPGRMRTSAAPEDVSSLLRFSLRARLARAWCACVDGRGLRSFSFPRDSQLAVHVSPPPSGRVCGGGGGCGMSLSARGPAECGAEDLLLAATPPPTAGRRGRVRSCAAERGEQRNRSPGPPPKQGNERRALWAPGREKRNGAV
jgi:hypothetical protein